MKILVSDPITEAGLSILKEAGLDVIYLPEGSEDEKHKAAVDVDGCPGNMRLWNQGT